MNIDEYYVTSCVRCASVVTADWDATGYDLICILCEVEIEGWFATPNFTYEQEAEYDEYLLATIGF